MTEPSDDPVITSVVDHDAEEHPPTGTLAITMIFLAVATFMFGWAYLLLIVRG